MKLNLPRETSGRDSWHARDVLAQAKGSGMHAAKDPLRGEVTVARSPQSFLGNRLLAALLLATLHGGRRLPRSPPFSHRWRCRRSRVRSRSARRSMR